MTTSHFQIKPDFYTIEECKNYKKKVNTNPRYPFFNQTHFTAGDKEQFEKYRNKTPGDICPTYINLSDNIFGYEEFYIWDKYFNLTNESVDNTFNYIFSKFKKGIFIQIRDNKVSVFLPFSKVNFTNEWGDKIKVDPKYKTIENFLSFVSSLEKRPFNPKKINTDPWKWYGNNCIMRFESPLGEGESGVTAISDMFKELCKHRKVPNIEFFVNRRDSPIISRYDTEAYTSFFGYDTPLLSHNYSTYAPILSMVTTDRNADLAIPTWEDWHRVQSIENNIVFPDKCRTYRDQFNLDWDTKYPVAVFRGASTGCGTTLFDNPRLIVSYISTLPENKDIDGLPYIDAGITKWNIRPRKTPDSPYLQTIEINTLPFGLVNPLTPTEQSNFKYIINIDGHVSAFRTSYELSMGSVLLIVESPYTMWFKSLLQPYVHYVPVKRDLTDLLIQVKWCKDNDDICRGIAQNALELYNTYLMKDGIFDYLQKLLVDLKHVGGTYIYSTITPRDITLQQEIIPKNYPESSIKPRDNATQVIKLYDLPPQTRNFSLNEGIKYTLNYLSMNKNGLDWDKILPYLSNPQLISKTKNSETLSYYFTSRRLLALKQSINQDKNDENMHEVFVGLTSTNTLLKVIPNFNFIYGYYKDNGNVNVVSEYIHSLTFEKWIESTNFKIDDYFWILIQICLAIQVAQERIGFVHHDLYPWNIIIVPLKTDIIFEYPTSNGSSLLTRIKTNIIPIIIDYGKSHVIYKGQHYGYIKPYTVSTIQDVLSILISSLNLVLEKNIDKADFSKIIHIANYLKNTNYLKYYGLTSFKNIHEIKSFTREAKKYSDMVEINKFELEERTPLSLVNHIQQIIDFGPKYLYTNLSIQNFDSGNPTQVFNFILSATDKQRVDSYINILYSLKMNTAPQPDNLLYKYICLQELSNGLTGVMSSLINYKPQHPEIRRIYEENIRYLEFLYLKDIAPSEIAFDLEPYKPTVSYTESSFTNMTEAETLLSNLKPVKDIDIINQKNIIIKSLTYGGKYQLKPEAKNYYLKVLDPLLKMNSTQALVSIANNNTFKVVEKKLLEMNIQALEPKLEIQDCVETVIPFLDEYRYMYQKFFE